MLKCVSVGHKTEKVIFKLYVIRLIEGSKGKKKEDSECTDLFLLFLQKSKETKLTMDTLKREAEKQVGAHCNLISSSVLKACTNTEKVWGWVSC